MDAETTQTILKEATQASYTTFLILILGLLGSVLGYINREVLGRFSKRVVNKFSTKAPTETNSNADDILNLELNRRVQEAITDLRIHSLADRVSVFQFHNGSVFRTKEPIWKISTTHESASIGTTSASDQCQDAKATLFTTMLVALYTKVDDIGITGVHNICANGEPCVGKRGIYNIDPESVSSTFIKGFIMNRGSTYSMVSPLLDDDDNIVGFVLVDYCDRLFDINKVQMTTKELWYAALCRTSTQISAQLLMACNHDC